MMGYKESYDVIVQFYLDCVKFWKKQGEEVLKAHDLAELDVKGITTNPYSPKGEKLDPKAMKDFLES